jgi:hypothetical protein
MNAALWILQSLLALVFAVSGTFKATLSKQRLIDSGQTGVVFFPTWAIRLIASAELLAVLGLVGPGIIGRWEPLTPVAATGVAVLMVGAATTHIRLNEPRNVAINAVIFVLAVVVAVGRF